jgi:hypothetical protein
MLHLHTILNLHGLCITFDTGPIRGDRKLKGVTVMVISPITPFSNTTGISFIYPTRPQNYTAPTPPVQADTVHLSGEALARSLRLQGYSAAGIAARMGSNLNLINQYLGIS